MNGFKKSPLNRVAKKKSVDPSSSSNPFNSDRDSDNKQPLKSSRRTSSEPSLAMPNVSTNPFDDDVRTQAPSLPLHSDSSAAKNKYRNDFSKFGGLENQSVQELENYAVYRAEETTETVNSCLKVAVDMREDATNTLVTLHQQGQQITKTHMVATDIDQDLSRGEKLLGSLGGMFSKTWKPKKNRPIRGPVISRDDSFIRRGAHLQQRERLGLSPMPKGQSNVRMSPPEPTAALQKIQLEKAKQEDAFSDLSDLLGELKEMAVDMGSEIERQNKALDHVHDDVDELNFRVKGANQRGRHLLRK